MSEKVKDFRTQCEGMGTLPVFADRIILLVLPKSLATLIRWWEWVRSLLMADWRDAHPIA